VVDFQRFKLQIGILFLKAGNQGFYLLTVLAFFTVEIDGADGTVTGTVGCR